jgi:CBS domain-containing protein
MLLTYPPCGTGKDSYMAQTIREVMTPNPVTLPATATVADAAQCMRDQSIGDVLVSDNGSFGIVTDRDIAVRVVAAGKDPKQAKLADCCSKDVATVPPDAAISEAARLMRDKAIRRLPVIENGKPVGMVSIGDLAVERDRDSALGDISAAPPNN